MNRQRLLALARAAVPPRLERHYRDSPAFRRRVHRAVRWSWLPIVLYSLVFADNGVASIVVRFVRLQRLEQQVTAFEERNARLRAEIARREKDPEAIERLARERYGMAFPGEKIYRIVEVSPAEARRLERERRRLEEEAREAAAEDAEASPAPDVTRRH